MRKIIASLVASTFMIATPAFADDKSAEGFRATCDSVCYATKHSGGINKTELTAYDIAWLKYWKPEETSGVHGGVFWMIVGDKYVEMPVVQLQSVSSKEKRIEMIEKAAYNALAEQLNSEILDLQDELADLTKSKAEALAEKAEEIAAMNIKITGLNSEISDLEAKLKAANADIEGYKEDLADVRDEVILIYSGDNEFTNLIQDLGVTLAYDAPAADAKMYKHFNYINDLMAAAQIKVDALQTEAAKIDGLEAKIEEHEGTISDLTSDVQDYLSLVNTLNSKLGAIDTKYYVSFTGTETINQRSTKLNAMVDKLHTDFDAQAQKILDQAADLETAGQTIEDLQSKLDTAKEDLVTANGEITTLNGHLVTLATTASVTVADSSEITLAEINAINAEIVSLKGFKAAVLAASSTHSLTAAQLAEKHQDAPDIDFAHISNVVAGSTGQPNQYQVRLLNSVLSFSVGQTPPAGLTEEQIVAWHANNTNVSISINKTFTSSSLSSAVEKALEEVAVAAYEKGYDDGYSDGYADGYKDGFADGVASVKNAGNNS